MKYSLAKIRSAARDLLTLEEKAPKRLFEGNALLRWAGIRISKLGISILTLFVFLTLSS